MANKCGDCQLFQGSGAKCGGGRTGIQSGSTACSSSFKAPASLFNNKKCGGCRLFQGSGSKCGGGRTGVQSGSTACSSSYAPIPG